MDFGINFWAYISTKKLPQEVKEISDDNEEGLGHNTHWINIWTVE
jgi:hypothetical protein